MLPPLNPDGTLPVSNDGAETEQVDGTPMSDGATAVTRVVHLACFSQPPIQFLIHDYS